MELMSTKLVETAEETSPWAGCSVVATSLLLNHTLLPRNMTTSMLYIHYAIVETAGEASPRASAACGGEHVAKSVCRG
ncbi:uncharacterized [Tachysurus ichikawai]